MIKKFGYILIITYFTILIEQQRFKYQFTKREMLPNLYEYITTWGAAVMLTIMNTSQLGVQ